MRNLPPLFPFTVAQPLKLTNQLINHPFKKIPQQVFIKITLPQWSQQGLSNKGTLALVKYNVSASARTVPVAARKSWWHKNTEKEFNILGKSREGHGKTLWILLLSAGLA